MLTECCETFGFRVPLLCDFNEDTGKWSRRYTGGGACPEGVGIDIDVELMQDEYTGECFTRVSSTNLSFSQDYDGWTLSGITFEGVDLSGNTLSVTIGCAGVVENPLALELCSPCSCQRCLPCKLCVQVAVPGRFFYDPDNDCQVTTDYIPAQYIGVEAAWNGNGWTVEPISLSFPEDPDGEFTLNISITLLPTSIGYCGLRIEASANYSSCFGSGSYEMNYPLDSGIDSRRWGGTDCISNEGIEESVGTPRLHPCPDWFPDCPSPTSQEYISLIDYSFYLEPDDPYSPLPLRPWVRVKDQSCGPCVMCQEPIPEYCCPDLPDTLTASAVGMISGDTGSVTLNRSGAATWSGTIPNFIGSCDLTISLECDPEREYPWRATATLAGDNTGVSDYRADGAGIGPPEVDCEAFEVIVQILTIGICGPIQAISITITA